MSTHKFEEVFGCNFGDKRKESGSPAPEANTYDVAFKTPSNSEDDVRFSISTMLFVHDKNIKLSVLKDGHELFSDNRSLSMFVNKTGIDPKPLKVRDDTHGGQEYEVNRTTHLFPNSLYTFRIYANKRNRLTSYYSGLDTKDEIEYGVPVVHEGEAGLWFPKD